MRSMTKMTGKFDPAKVILKTMVPQPPPKQLKTLKLPEVSLLDNEFKTPATINEDPE